LDPTHPSSISDDLPGHEVAGMDGNRTNPGRLSSAPQTVLKAVGLTPETVYERPLRFSHKLRQFRIVRIPPLLCAGLAVILAVSDRVGLRPDATCPRRRLYSVGRAARLRLLETGPLVLRGLERAALIEIDEQPE